MNKAFFDCPSRHTCINSISPHLFLFVFVLAWTTPALAQDTQEMPLFLIEGSRYARQSFDVNGDLERSQRLEISRLSRREESLEVQVTLYGSEENGQTPDTVRTTIQCRIREANMVMNVLSLILPEGRRVSVRVTGGEVLYPFRPPVPDTLEDVTLEVRVKQGIVGFLGGKSRMHFRNRRLQPSTFSSVPEEKVYYTITEDLHVNFYALGIKVRERSYRVEETIQPDLGLVRHVLRAPDGSYVLLERFD